MNSHALAEPSFQHTDESAIPWKASRLAPGVDVKNLGMADGRAMQLVRFQPGTIFPVHCHAGPEFIYILEGEAIQNGQRLGPGWAGVAASGTIDEQFRSETGCVFLLVNSL